ncbi:MAG: hypothetical protein Q8M17_10925 [Actinomycetota bacterium]|nr:hypothetical protein [Actinomycetota bacterium]
MTVSYRALYGLVAAVAVARLLLITLLLPDGSSHFPDEINYAELAAVISGGGDWQAWNSGEGATLLPANLALLGPAALGITLGVEPLASVRLVSIVLSALAQACLIWIISTIPAVRQERSADRLRVLGWPMLAIAVFVLLPGSLFWNSLGLKESAVTLASLLAVAACIVFVRSGRLFVRATALVVVLGCVGLQMISRAYIAPALLLSVGVFLAWNALSQARAVAGRQRLRALAPILTAVAIVGMLGVATIVGSGATPSEQSSLASRVATSIGVQSPLQHVMALRGIRARTATIGESGVVMEACATVPAEGVETLYCEALRLPAATASIITRPMWPIDDFDALSPGWSRFGLAVQVDSLASVALVLLVLFLAATHRIRSRPLAATAVVYFVSVLIGLALIEGNMGTWMRHRLMLLWPLCLLIALTGLPRWSRRSPAAPSAEEITTGVGH